MSATAITRLLHEMEAGFVVPERYARRSLYGRCEPIVATTVLAVIALCTSMLLGGSTSARR